MQGARLMACCALESCQNPACAVCTVSERCRVVKCPRWVDGASCGLVAGHWGDCRPAGGRKAVKADTRDGDPKLAGERKRQHPMFVKRKREGPVRQQRA
jgi:hypothetical protein